VVLVVAFDTFLWGIPGVSSSLSDLTLMA